MARAISESMDMKYERIQFTPDLLPTEITGIEIYNQKREVFEFQEGPIFANLVLADEINRASPKTQSALLEVMEERHVTVGKVRRQAGLPFLVIATQNPIEQSGTYPLPEAQLDRFMIKTKIGYTDVNSTVEILKETSKVSSTLKPVSKGTDILTMSALSREVIANEAVLRYIVEIVEETRRATQIRVGASVRGARNLTKLAKTWALSKGRNYIIPDDVKELATHVLAHRVVLTPDAQFAGLEPEKIIGEILGKVTAPTGNFEV
jgi:MoxR-like ATPase